MKFHIKWIGQYLDISIEGWSASIDLGMHDEVEAQTLLTELESAVDELKDYLAKQDS